MKKRIVGIGFLLLGIIISSVLIVSCLKEDGFKRGNLFEKTYETTSKVGYSCEYLGFVDRKIPIDFKDEGYSSVGYPKYGETFSVVSGDSNVALRQSIIDEAYYLASIDTKGSTGHYNRFDSEGYLYLNDSPSLGKNNEHRKLYRHTASKGMYLGDVSDEEKGVIKKITMSSRGYLNGYGVTGLYAPAGEIVKVEISKDDMVSTEGITIHIGQALFNGQPNNIWSSRDMNRMPVILNTLQINEDTAEYNVSTGMYTAYIGSFLGGPIYIRNENVRFSMVISGAVRYSHFILGYTSQEEFEMNNTSVPYFDLEVCETGVLHSGPKKYVESFGYDNFYNAGVLWDKISNVSTQVSKQGVVFLYDPFVAAGAAVAFPGRGSVNCPMSWFADSLNYDSFIQNGSWGNIHEYNHNFQGWGVGDGGEVTNNALSLVSYSAFTRVSSNRMIGSSNENLSGWNRYTSPSWSLNDIVSGTFENGKKGLSIYSTLLHSFGQSVFMDTIKKANSQSVDDWFSASVESSNYDMTYYYKDLIGYDVSSDVLKEVSDKKLSMFVPVSSIYQTGRSYIQNGEKRYSRTTQPYQIGYNESVDLDLNRYTFSNNKCEGSIVIPDGFSYKIKSVSNPENGMIMKVSDYKYKFIPNDNCHSGKIYVTLEITKNDGKFDVEDVDLVFEFEKTYEINKYKIGRTVYIYDSNVYTSAKDAFENGYSGYVDKKEGYNDNTFSTGRVVQDCNAEIWLENEEVNKVMEINGKYKIGEDGKYRFALRGRYNCALFVSLDEGNSYNYCAEYTNNTSSSADFPNNEGTYIDCSLYKGKWVYFKAVLICEKRERNSFIGVGVGKFEENKVVINKINAFNESYEENEDVFSSDYLFENDYLYSYQDNKSYKNVEVSMDNYFPWNGSEHKIGNLIDGNYSTYIHTNYQASSDKPLEIKVKLDSVVVANRLSLFTQSRSDPHYPKSFSLYCSLDGVNYSKVSDFTNVKLNGNRIDVDFSEREFQYYKLVISESSNKYIILSEVVVQNINEINDGHHISLDRDNVNLYGEWEKLYKFSSFGHLYKGVKGSSFEYEFYGNRFGILSSYLLDNKIEVYIDGERYTSICLKDCDMKFATSLLDNGFHNVEIRCLDNVEIDSIVYW